MAYQALAKNRLQVRGEASVGLEPGIGEYTVSKGATLAKLTVQASGERAEALVSTMVPGVLSKISEDLNRCGSKLIVSDMDLEEIMDLMRKSERLELTSWISGGTRPERIGDEVFTNYLTDLKLRTKVNGETVTFEMHLRNMLYSAKRGPAC